MDEALERLDRTCAALEAAQKTQAGASA
jgi:hypothetical protein